MKRRRTRMPHGRSCSTYQHWANDKDEEEWSSLEHSVSVALRWVVDIGVIKEVLNAKQDLKRREGKRLSHSVSISPRSFISQQLARSVQNAC